MIELLNVSKTFSSPDGPVRALENVTFTVPRGKICAVLGPNGSGKTTLLKILSTHITPDKGAAGVAGHDCMKKGGEIRKLTGQVSGEDRNFYGRLSVRENLRFYCALYSIFPSEASRKTDILLKELELTEWGNRQYQLLPAGAARRLSLARALLHVPSVLLMDEPTRSLDPASAALIRKILSSMKNMTMLIATHDPSEARELAGVCAVLEHGKLKDFGETGRVLGVPGTTP